jgi:hypothetical protein
MSLQSACLGHGPKLTQTWDQQEKVHLTRSSVFECNNMMNYIVHVKDKLQEKKNYLKIEPQIRKSN